MYLRTVEPFRFSYLGDFSLEGEEETVPLSHEIVELSLILNFPVSNETPRLVTALGIIAGGNSGPCFPVTRAGSNLFLKPRTSARTTLPWARSTRRTSSGDSLKLWRTCNEYTDGYVKTHISCNIIMLIVFNNIVFVPPSWSVSKLVFSLVNIVKYEYKE